MGKGKLKTRLSSNVPSSDRSDLFVDCGLTSTESSVLVYLLQFGPREAGILAKRMNLKRPTVYSALNSLEDKQLVSRETRNGVTTFMPLSPSKIPEVMLGKAKQQFERVRDSVGLILPRLNEFPELSAARIGSFDIQILEGEDPYETIVSNFILSNPFYAIWDPAKGIYNSRMKARMSEIVTYWNKTRNRIREIIVKSPMSEWYLSIIDNPNHQVRVIDRDLKSIADCILVDGSVFFTLNVPDRESAIQILNPDHYRFMEGIFEELWSKLKQP